MSSASTQHQNRQAGSPSSQSSSRINTPSAAAQLRRRQIQRSSTTPLETPADLPSPLTSERRLRRSSTFSDTVSEARNSIKTSTDDLLLPRPSSNDVVSGSNSKDSFWQSTPLALALLPALAGVLFHNGSAFLTDVTLLALVAVFLNWSIRLPWDWYYSAQQSTEIEHDSCDIDLDGIVEEATEDGSTADDPRNATQHKDTVLPCHPVQPDQVVRARRELHVNELAALASCFLFPLIGTWLLHTIRSQLSRPSEGLVSNYNLTIFVLAAEIRPFSHLLKLVQTRTLYLQRIVQSHQQRSSTNNILLSELSKRLEELEYTMTQVKTQQETSQEVVNTSRKGQELDRDAQKSLITEMRKTIQPDLDALHRSLRRQEKRTTASSFETGSRLRELEMRTHGLGLQIDSIHKDRPRGLLSRLSNVAWAVAMIPLQALRTMADYITRTIAWPFDILLRLLESKKSHRKRSSGHSKSL